MVLLKQISLIFLLSIFFISCNPFAPGLDDDLTNTGGGLSDLKTIEGVFNNFQYAYTLRDTLIYGELLRSDFTFTYRDYDQGIDVSWGRDEEMKTTYGLFQNSQRLDLIWNNIILSSQDSLNANIVRGFNLTITFNPTDIVRIDGRVNLTLKKDLVTQKWQIAGWLDESNF
ncbi:MAG: hypothetical protein ACM3O3_09830 [Syntrophothermus sp.]